MSLPPSISHQFYSHTMLSRQALLRSMRTATPQRAVLSQSRSFAAAAPAAASNENIKPPIALFGLDGTYATALVRLIPETTNIFFWLSP